MAAAKLAEKIKQRQSLFTRIELTFKTIALYDEHTDLLLVERSQEEITKLETALTTLHSGIVSLTEKQEDLDEAEQIVYEVCQTLWKMSVLVKKLLPAPEKTNSNSNASTSHNIKLPKSELPKFHGKQEDWMSFRDLFTAAVINDKSQADSQRLYYLSLAVKGEAWNLIKNFSVTDGNFKQAWDTLTERYENKGDLIYKLIKGLLNLRTVSTENVSHLRKLLDSTNECLRSLKVLGVPVDGCDDLLVVILAEKLDKETRKEWAKSRKGSREMSTLKELTDFLDSHIRALSTAGATDGGNSKASSSKESSHSGEPKTAHFTSFGKPCLACKEDHKLYKCPKFADLGLKERVKFVKAKKLCVKCLGQEHVAPKTCFLKRKCSICMEDHSDLLHDDARYQAKLVKKLDDLNSGPSTTESPVFSIPKQFTPEHNPFGGFTEQPKLTSVLLCTAVVRVKDKWGNFQFCRAFLDQGSQVSAITEACRIRLGLPMRWSDTEALGGLADMSTGNILGLVNLQLFSWNADFGINVSCEVLTKVTGSMPNFSFERVDWDHIKGLELADPEFHKCRPVDLMIGGDYYNYIIKERKIMGPPLTPTAQDSELGWILSGKVTSSPFAGMVTVHHVSKGWDGVKKFWELEEVPHYEQMTKEENLAEEHFKATHTRETSGRFVVSLPYNDNLKDLGSSREIARRRLIQLEKRLPRFPEHHKEYRKFMKEYEELGHMSKIPYAEGGERVGETNYLPHHFVLKEDSSTTKLRVVFDASCKTSTGISFNDCLMVGPTIQDDIFALLLRFRMNPVALKADVAKMYRQFNVPKSDQDRQRILWRDSPEHPIQEYRLHTVTYGTASGPFLATRCLKQLATEHQMEFPIGSKTALKEMYVDDLLGGAKQTTEAVQLVDELRQLMGRGCLDIRKWISSHKEVLEHLPEHLRDRNGSILVDKETPGKALGVCWDSVRDIFCFSGYSPRDVTKPTKRNVLSEISRIYDPLGWLSPFTVGLKIFFQELWKPVESQTGESQILAWDELIPEEHLGTWKEYLAGMEKIKEFELKRCILDLGIKSYELHGFSDASEKAYSAVVYVRCVQADDTVTSLILVGKTRVAPIRHVSIPRLELCGALLLSRLITAVTVATGIKCPIYSWTDSEIVLRWISASSRRWSTFVANRVGEIQEKLPSESWRYVPSKDNPADCASRGLTATELIGFDLWWHGPEWLRFPTVPTFQNENKTFGPELEEKRKIQLVNTITKDWIKFGTSLVKRYSNINLLRRVVACLLRFGRNCRKPKAERETGFLKRTEHQEAWNLCIKWTQMEDFPEEFRRLEEKRPVRVDSRIVSLDPYLDNSGLLRVGGRLKNSLAKRESKHQLILAGHHQLTKAIIRHCHQIHHHAGFKLLTTTLLRTYYILRSRQAIKAIVRSCPECRRHRGETMRQMMGNLPSPRVQPSRPFTHSGVDFAGHFTLQPIKGRGKVQFKGYFCVFVCFSTKAVHLEAVTQLTAEAFLLTLKRFIARRGFPSHMYSDCGGNFQKTDREIREFVSQCKNDERLNRFLGDKQMEWHFNSPEAPHQGGLWEAAVKSAKYHFKRVVGDTTLTLEEFGTILCEIEAILNSRPLCPLSCNLDDMDVLTPGHFLIGEPLTALPERDVTDAKISRLSRWERTQQITQHFWRRWKDEYLGTLQQRAFWTRKSANAQEGDLVLIKDDDLPARKWRRGRITKVHAGADGLVRVVTIKTDNGELQRPVVKVVPLIPWSDEESVARSHRT